MGTPGSGPRLHAETVARSLHEQYGSEAARFFASSKLKGPWAWATLVRSPRPVIRPRSLTIIFSCFKDLAKI